MNLSNLSANDLRRAASLRERIDALTKELTNILGATAPTTGAVGVQKKRTFSAAVKRKMAASQKARWAKIKGSAPAATATVARKKGKRTMSAAAKAAISKAATARWAKIKAAQKS